MIPAGARSGWGVLVLAVASIACSREGPPKTAERHAEAAGGLIRSSPTPTASPATATAAGETTPDPVVLTVNLRQVTRSELTAELEKMPKPDLKQALRAAAERALLLQEADRSGLGEGLPVAPDERAQAFLRRVVSRRVVCNNISESEMRQMYGVMRPRFARGHLYRVAEIQWRCQLEGDEADPTCAIAAHAHAQEKWIPLLDALEEPLDLYWLAAMHDEVGPHLRYLEYTFHTDEQGRSSVDPIVAAEVTRLSVGQATVTRGLNGARLHLLAEHRPPISRGLDSPGVRDEVRDTLCPRLVKQSRRHYLDQLVGSAYLKVHEEHLPESKNEDDR